MWPIRLNRGVAAIKNRSSYLDKKSGVQVEQA